MDPDEDEFEAWADLGGQQAPVAYVVCRPPMRPCNGSTEWCLQRIRWAMSRTELGEKRGGFHRRAWRRAWTAVSFTLLLPLPPVHIKHLCVYGNFVWALLA